MGGSKSIQFYYDDADGDLKKKLHQVARARWKELRLSTSQIAKALLIEKLKEEERSQNIREVTQLHEDRDSSS